MPDMNNEMTASAHRQPARAELSNSTNESSAQPDTFMAHVVLMIDYGHTVRESCAIRPV